MRFIYDAVLVKWIEEDFFWYCVIYDIVSLFDGLSFLALLLLHFKNFRQRVQS